MGKKNIVFVFVKDYLDWESALLLNFIRLLGEDRYAIKTAGMTKKPVSAISGVNVIPDYIVGECIGGVDALLLIGGVGWMDRLEEKILALAPVIADAMERDLPIGGIGTGVSVMGAYGLLNHALHAGNSPAEIHLFSELGNAPDPYHGDDFFVEAGAIRNGNIITGKNIAGLALARAFTWALDIDQEKADILYNSHLLGASMPAIGVTGNAEELIVV